MAFPTFRNHGTPSAYNKGCSCDDCRAAHRERVNRSLARMRARGLAPDDPRHGHHNTYKNWACRCDPCRAAHSAEMKRRRPGKAARS
jgi:hypothetical protein